MPAVSLLDKLRGVLGAAHVLTGVDLAAYALEGRTPEAAIFPGSVDDVCAVLRLAAEEGVPVLPWGGGTAMSVGAPPGRAGLVLCLRRLDRVLEHEPGDLTATVEAGKTFSELQAALRAHSQWVSLDPADSGRATVGGVLAADAAGPRRHLYGTARDALIGLTVVTADGVVVKGGGKVVKNVAGYDLPKLFVGSYGTLGVIVEATFRLRPLPDDERLVAVGFDRLKDAGAGARAVLGSDLIPNALELLDAEAARSLGRPGVTLVVGFDGLREQIDWQCGELERLVAPLGARSVTALDDDAWGLLSASAARARSMLVAVLRLALLPSHAGDAMEEAAAVARSHALQAACAAHAGAGVVTAALFADGGSQDPAAIAAVLREWRRIAHGGDGHATLEWAPLAVKELVPVWEDLGAPGRIMQRIKAQLDPKNVLNPGRFVAGI